ncbi:hypothetical protein pipiens_000247 [Culex pipiens pipiens]|uniref:Uncharacterized protein n=1 Tax=Culex pipiens pipiens TaxID=38569 RepID=A0ABD1DCQ2_CULPP
MDEDDAGSGVISLPQGGAEDNRLNPVKFDRDISPTSPPFDSVSLNPANPARPKSEEVSGKSGRKAFHLECLQCNPPEGRFIYGEFESGRMHLNDESQHSRT